MSDIEKNICNDSESEIRNNDSDAVSSAKTDDTHENPELIVKDETNLPEKTEDADSEKKDCLYDDEFSDDEFEDDDEYEEWNSTTNPEEDIADESSATEITEKDIVKESLRQDDSIKNTDDMQKQHSNGSSESLFSILYYKLHNTEKNRLVKNSMIIGGVLLLVILILTDIIPVLPNSYHRSYVGNRFTLGETRNCDYDKFGDNILYVGGGALCIFGPDMTLEYRKEIHTGIPVVRTNSKNAIVFFKNSGEYVVMHNNDVTEYSIEESICSAYITEDGYHAIVTDAVAGHNACVTVYSPDGEFIYEWFTNYDVLDCAVTPSGTNMVASIVEINDSGVSGKLIFFDLTKSNPIAEISLEDDIIFEMFSIETGKIVAMGESMTIAYTPDGKKTWQIDYADKNLKTYDISYDGTIAFVFDRYTSAQSESLIETYDFNGKNSGTYISERNVKRISANNSHCLLTLENGTVLLNSKGRAKKIKELNMNFEKAILFENYNFGFVIHDGVSEIVSVCH